LDGNSAFFSLYSWLENQLISAPFLGWKFGLFQLVILARKSAPFQLHFSSISWLEIQRFSACILG